MNTKRRSQAWNTKQLQAFGKAAASGYVPGVEQSTVSHDVWNTQRHLRAGQMRAQVFVPGF